MYLSVKEYEVLKEAVALLPHDEEYKALDKETQQKILDADVVLVGLWVKRKEFNAKSWNYIKERRKKDKNYCRTPYKKKREG